MLRVLCRLAGHRYHYARDLAMTITAAQDAAGTDVAIRHDPQPRWPLVGGLLADWIVGRFFVGDIAGKTLRRIRVLAEAEG